ncbi:MAG: 3-hydroxyacyl-CoA dehydrogenase family protein, partial [Pseudomonadota bacterium]
MAFWFRGRSIAKVGVIGSGQIGPDIALHFAKTLYAHDAKIVVVDVSEDALAKGKAKLTKKIDKGAETKAFKPAQADAMKACVLFTSDYGQLAGADFVVEAATEDLPLKRRIFKQIEGLVSPDAILGSNSSHIEPERIFAEVEHKGRALCTHYFFPAERNPAMEIIPTTDTDPAITDFIMRLYEFVGKIPVKVGSRYGYSVDPVFEGLMLACIQCLDAGMGNSKQVDTVGAKCLGLAVGPLTAQNLTGGNPISAHGMSEMHERLVPWYRSPKRLDDMVAAKSDWEVPGRGEKVEISPELEKELTD